MVCMKTLSCTHHRCQQVCHSGPCYPCQHTKCLSCPCGATSIQVPCGREKLVKKPNCLKNCLWVWSRVYLLLLQLFFWFHKHILGWGERSNKQAKKARQQLNKECHVNHIHYGNKMLNTLSRFFKSVLFQSQKTLAGEIFWLFWDVLDHFLRCSCVSLCFVTTSGQELLKTKIDRLSGS